MIKKILFSILCLLLCSLTASAQTSFDDKKRSPNTSSAAVKPAKFNVSKLNIQARTRNLNKGRTLYQLPSVFNGGITATQYSHEIIASSASGMPLFIESTAGEAVKGAMKGQGPLA